MQGTKENIDEHIKLFLKTLFPINAFKMVSLWEQVETCTSELPKYLHAYCLKNKGYNMT